MNKNKIFDYQIIRQIHISSRLLRYYLTCARIWTVNAFICHLTKLFKVHESLGVPSQCSKSIATRMAYVICIHCCHDLNIQRIPGKHMPDPSKIPINQPPVPAEVPVKIYVIHYFHMIEVKEMTYFWFTAKG